MMATSRESSSDDDLPARVVNVKQHHLRNESQATRTGVGMPTYTIQHDAPWVPARISPSQHTTTSATGFFDITEDDENVPPLPPLSIHKVSSYHPSYHAHPKQHIIDVGPPTRPTKLPIFKQVRSMLQKSAGPTSVVKYDGFSGEPSEFGKEPQVKPSTYVPPTPRQVLLQARGRSVKHAAKKTPARNISPVSIMRDEEILSADQLSSARYKTPSELDISPPASPTTTISTMFFGNASTPDFTRWQTPPMPSHHNISRKPAPLSALGSTTANENHDPERSPSATSNWTEPPDDEDRPQKESHFSWTTFASSARPATSNMATPPQSFPHATPRNYLNSRFSWSTVNTTVSQAPASPPREPLPPIPAKYMNSTVEPPRGLHVQSILSRSRPVDRIEKEEWTPPPRKRVTATPPSSDMTHLTNPKSLTRKPVSTTPNSGVKALPLPPELAAHATPLSHLDDLLAREKDLLHQRKNIERGILQQELVVNASPLDVSFTDVRAAKKKLTLHQKHLAEIQLDVREVGVAISRVRRKEGEPEGLWVRRVTF